MEAAVKLMELKYFSDELFESDVLPPFLKHLQLDQVDLNCDLKMSKMLGRFIHSIPNERNRADSHLRSAIISFLKRLTVN